MRDSMARIEQPDPEVAAALSYEEKRAYPGLLQLSKGAAIRVNRGIDEMIGALMSEGWFELEATRRVDYWATCAWHLGEGLCRWHLGGKTFADVTSEEERIRAEARGEMQSGLVRLLKIKLHLASRREEEARRDLEEADRDNQSLRELLARAARSSRQTD